MMFRCWSLYPQYTPHCADNRIGIAALHFVLLVLCTQVGVVQTSSTMPTTRQNKDTDLPSCFLEDSDEDIPEQDWTPGASKFRMRRAFEQIALLTRLKARASVDACTAIAGYTDNNLTVAILKWRVHAFHKRGLAHIKSDHFKELWQGNPAPRAVLNLQCKATDDPWVLVLNCSLAINIRQSTSHTQAKPRGSWSVP